MSYFIRIFAFTLLLVASPLWARDHNFRLAAPQALIDSGLLKYMLPRFSLKTQVRITLVSPGDAAEAAFGNSGTPVFDGPAQQWKLALAAPDHIGVGKFINWITSKVGQRAITGFKVDGIQLFTLPKPQETRVMALDPDGDPVLGEMVARSACRRCHAISKADRMNTIGSTPSFLVLRSLPDWSERFQAFYALNPHPAFTQVKDVTAPFAIDRPPSIVPVNITLDELEAIIAFVAGIEPADLGAPLVHQ